MNFVTSFIISANWKSDSYDLILVIINWLTKMVYYKPVKVTIDILGLVEVIINMVMCHHGVLESIITNQDLLFISKCWSLLCYFLGIKRKLFTAFYLQTNGQTKKQNSTMEVYLRVFVNWKKNDWARLLPMAKFTYNNTKNTSTGHTSFKLYSRFHSQMSFEKDVNLCSRSYLANKLADKLRELMRICCQNLLHT